LYDAHRTATRRMKREFRLVHRVAFGAVLSTVVLVDAALDIVTRRQHSSYVMLGLLFPMLLYSSPAIALQVDAFLRWGSALPSATDTGDDMGDVMVPPCCFPLCFAHGRYFVFSSSSHQVEEDLRKQEESERLVQVFLEKQEEAARQLLELEAQLESVRQRTQFNNNGSPAESEHRLTEALVKAQKAHEVNVAVDLHHLKLHLDKLPTGEESDSPSNSPASREPLLPHVEPGTRPRDTITSVFEDHGDNDWETPSPPGKAAVGGGPSAMDLAPLIDTSSAPGLSRLRTPDALPNDEPFLPTPDTRERSSVLVPTGELFHAGPDPSETSHVRHRGHYHPFSPVTDMREASQPAPLSGRSCADASAVILPPVLDETRTESGFQSFSAPASPVNRQRSPRCHVMVDVSAPSRSGEHAGSGDFRLAPSTFWTALHARFEAPPVDRREVFERSPELASPSTAVETRLERGDISPAREPEVRRDEHVVDTALPKLCPRGFWDSLHARFDVPLAAGGQ